MLVYQDRSFSIMIMFAIALHYAWAAILVSDSSALEITALTSMNRNLGMPWLVVVLLTAATMAVSSLVTRISGVWFVLLLIPQQLILMTSAESAIEAIWLSQFADGVVRSRAFLAADQCYSILAMIGHTVAIVAHVGGFSRNGRR